ncbi:CHAP domain-containing protein [Nonomuraea sp. NPDC050451]|uniref:CHAP domain-containing protein n=1 Tax=Nonomuraea sp. NPDC050451 TaxID=3364364 RepID=UPI00378DAED7
MRQELGYKEKNGQFTKFGQWYADRVQDTQYRNGPWCDMFIAWAADKADLSQYVGEFAWTPSHAAWFMKQGAWTQKPEPGALVFFDWKGGKSYKGIDHVGIVESVSGKKIHTIEANVDRIWLKRKTRETDKVVGYGIPRMVKAGADKLGEIRSTERPFVPAPRVDTGQGSPLDVLGTPPALLTAMVLMTVLLSLRITGRRRGTHRRLTWPWNAPTTPHLPPQPEKARERVTVRAKASPPEHTQAKPHPTPAPTARPARARVTAAAATRHPTSTRRKPYEPGSPSRG